MAGEKRERNTQQRRVILEELRRSASHPTAAELYQAVRGRLPRISLGTVYRNLEMLSRKGTVQKLSLGGTEARFDGNLAPHHHVRCVRCGRLNDIHGLPAGVVRDDLAEVDGYEILGHRLEFMGICPDCKNQRPADESETTQRPST